MTKDDAAGIDSDRTAPGPMVGADAAVRRRRPCWSAGVGWRLGVEAAARQLVACRSRQTSSASTTRTTISDRSLPNRERCRSARVRHAIHRDDCSWRRAESPRGCSRLRVFAREFPRGPGIGWIWGELHPIEMAITRALDGRRVVCRSPMRRARARHRSPVSRPRARRSRQAPSTARASITGRSLPNQESTTRNSLCLK